VKGILSLTATQNISLDLFIEVATCSLKNWISRVLYYPVPKDNCILFVMRGLSAKYPAILNISRTGRVALM